MNEREKCGETACSGDCAHCSEKHSDNVPTFEPANKNSKVKHIIAVMSGKGGVGKSMVTASLAVMMNRKGFKVGILDGDITGPSIPKMFGTNGRVMATEDGIIPAETANGIKIISVNLMLQNPEAPVAWRGPVIGGAVKQFWTDVSWGELDYLFIDMPPGTGDVPLTVFQSIPVDAAVTVTTPQDLVSLIVKKSVGLAEMMNIKMLGIIENMSFIKCPDCGKKIELFGKSGVDDICNELGLLKLAQMPIDPALAELADEGEFEKNGADEYLSGAAEALTNAFPV